jgi:glucose-1-phosphate cytidylyltransferase
MKLVILCGGLGTRLREETEFRPKPMVNVGNRPILWHIMKIYAHYGYTDFVFALGYKGEMIKQYFCHYELMNNDVTIELGKEKALKGARLKRVEKYIDGDTFMVTYGDGLANVDINELIDFHKSHGKLATLTGISPTSRFGELRIKGNQVESFSEKPTDTDGLINGGFFVFNRGLFDYLSTDDDCDLEIGALERIASEGQLMVFKHLGFWACMDNIRDMDYLNRLWSEGKAEWKVWP